MTREIVLDTETTGLYSKSGDRIIEIGCIELINRVRTGAYYHVYINPQRDIHPDAVKVHGINNEFLLDKPVFSKIAEEFCSFIANSQLVIHNAGFDMSFINAELARLGLPEVPMNRVVDTLTIARRKFPGAPASLDALCKRFKISLDRRDKHGALIDAELLADVYIELTGGIQSTIKFSIDSKIEINSKQISRPILQFPMREFNPSKDEEEKHKEFVKKIANTLWEDVGN